MRRTAFETNEHSSTEYVVGLGSVTDLGSASSALTKTPYALLIDNGASAAHPHVVSSLATHKQCLGSLVLVGAEKTKSLDELARILDFLQDCALPKHGIVVTIGGGAVCDVSALAATLFRRGVKLVLLPTTLLAQVDAAIGGKNGINFRFSKNSVGSFHHPMLVCCDPQFLNTLGERAITCGVAEVIKTFAVGSQGAFERFFPTDELTIPLEEGWGELVWATLNIKLQLLKADPFEQSSRRLLNYGHAFAHFLEEHSEYSLLHGEAVLLGMLLENAISRELQIGSKFVGRVDRAIFKRLTLACRTGLTSFDAILPDIARLKQVRRGSMSLVCLADDGQPKIIDDVPLDLLRRTWEQVRKCIDIPAVTSW